MIIKIETKEDSYALQERVKKRSMERSSSFYKQGGSY